MLERKGDMKVLVVRLKSGNPTPQEAGFALHW